MPNGSARSCNRIFNILLGDLALNPQLRWYRTPHRVPLRSCLLLLYIVSSTPILYRSSPRSSQRGLWGAPYDITCISPIFWCTVLLVWNESMLKWIDASRMNYACFHNFSFAGYWPYSTVGRTFILFGRNALFCQNCGNCYLLWKFIFDLIK